MVVGGIPALLLSRVLGLGKARGDVIPGEVTSAWALVPYVLIVEGCVIAALAVYFHRRQRGGDDGGG